MSKRWRSFEKHNSRIHVAMLCEISAKSVWLLRFFSPLSFPAGNMQPETEVDTEINKTTGLLSFITNLCTHIYIIKILSQAITLVALFTPTCFDPYGSSSGSTSGPCQVTD